MTKVGFYLLESSAELELGAAANSQMLYASRLAEKASGQGLNIYIHCNEQAAAETLSQQLWALRPDSFLAHNLVTAELEHPAPILIGWPKNDITSLDEKAKELQLGNHAVMDDNSLMINLADTPPDFVGRFTRAAEIVASDEPSKVKGRQRYRFYKDLGYPLSTHKIQQ